MKVLAFLLLMILPRTTFCQDISGKWTGNYGKNVYSASINQLVVDIELYNDSLVRGSSQLLYDQGKFEHYVINGVYRKSDSTIYFSETREIDVNLGYLTTIVMGNYTMKLKVDGITMRFEGKWRENDTSQSNTMATNVWLEKGAVEKPGSAGKSRTQIHVTRAERNTVPKDKKPEKGIVIQRELEIDTIERDSIRIDIIDNAKIDNDIISVYLGDSLVLHKHTISREPATFNIFLDERNPMRTIRIAAESYGSMPPCTAHMRVTTCKSIYTFDVQSTYRTDAAVEFFLKGSRNSNPALR